MGVELPAAPLVGPDVAIDRLVADGQLTGPTKHRRDLLGTPLEGEPPRDERELRRREPIAAATAPPSRAGPGLGKGGAIAAIRARVPGQFPADRAAVPPQRPSDVGGAEPESPGSTGPMLRA